MAKPPHHGGDLSGANEKYGTPAEGWLDLSTGINRTPYPTPEVTSEVWQRLPLAEDFARAERAARTCYGVPDAAGMVIAPGTQALIQWLPRLRKPASVAVVGPTYAEHAQAWRRAGHSVLEVATLQDAGDADAVIVVNPNNPDGARTDPEDLLETAKRLARRQGLLVVDEAFADIAPDLSVVPHLPQPGLFVLRSLGKFYGLAGARVGFGIGGPDQVERVVDALGPWAVAGPSLIAAAAALEDDSWRAESRARLAENADRLDTLLAASGFIVEGGTDLYRLVRHGAAASIADALGRAGILVRTFETRPLHLRFGIPGSEAEWQRLSEALRGHSEN